jgi:MinD-like ATPase involved in chromosome partitioning or flagellar assembly
MSNFVTVHSFRRGVGRSSLVVNLAASLAQQGRRVAIVDADFQASSVHLFFGISESEIKATLNDYLAGQCKIHDAVQDITPKLGAHTSGKLLLISASNKTNDIMQMLRTGMNVDRFTEGLTTLSKDFSLDYLLIDAASGLNEDTLTTIAVSNSVVLVMHPDSQNYQGTAVTVEVARKLQISAIHIVLNDAPSSLNAVDMHNQIEQAYHCGPGTILSHSDELLALGSGKVFVVEYPQHPLAENIKTLAMSL